MPATSPRAFEFNHAGKVFRFELDLNTYLNEDPERRAAFVLSRAVHGPAHGAWSELLHMPVVAEDRRRATREFAFQCDPEVEVLDAEHQSPLRDFIARALWLLHPLS